VVLVLIAAAAAGPVVRAAVDVIEVALVVVAALVAVAVTVAAVVVVRRRRRRLAPARATLTARVESVSVNGRQAAAAIEPPRDVDVSAYLRGYANTRVVTGRAARPRCAHRDGRRS
jgi:hypothetical protein